MLSKYDKAWTALAGSLAAFLGSDGVAEALGALGLPEGLVGPLLALAVAALTWLVPNKPLRIGDDGR